MIARLTIRGTDFFTIAKRLYHKINRPMLQMQPPPVGQKGYLGSVHA